MRVCGRWHFCWRSGCCDFISACAKGDRHASVSNLLWKKLFYNEQSKTFWEKFLHNLLMYLQIVILLMLILALMAPFVQRKGTGSTDVVYLIDTSGSMKHLTKGGQSPPRGSRK